MRELLMAAALLNWIGPAWTDARHFPEATETDQELIDLYEEAGGLCNHSMSRDVRIVVACLSQNVYGLALNARGFCRGKQDQANAFAQWHECDEQSLRFPPLQLQLPAGFR